MKMNENQNELEGSKKNVAIERLGEEHMDRMWIFFFTLVYKNVYITVIVGQKSYGFIYW